MTYSLYGSLPAVGGFDESYLWSQLIARVDCIPDSSQLTKKLSIYLSRKLRQEVHHKMALEEQTFYFGDDSIDLSRKPMIYKTFEFFLKHRNDSVSWEKAAKYLYGLEDKGELSHRLWLSYHQNAIKLISRARILAEKHLPASRQISGWEWFPYDNKKQSWRLYRIYDDIIL